MIDLTKQPPLEFSDVSKEKFPCFYLAKEVAIEGESFPTAMNAANELAVSAFLEKRIKFNDIYKILSEVLISHKKTKLSSVEEVYAIDEISRNITIEILKKYN